MAPRDLAAFFTARVDTAEVPADVHGPLDLYALTLMASLVPTARRILGAAEHDKVYLNADPAVVNAVATDDQLLALMACGVCYDDYEDCFYLFV